MKIRYLLAMAIFALPVFAKNDVVSISEGKFLNEILKKDENGKYRIESHRIVFNYEFTLTKSNYQCTPDTICYPSGWHNLKFYVPKGTFSNFSLMMIPNSAVDIHIKYRGNKNNIFNHINPPYFPLGDELSRTLQLPSQPTVGASAVNACNFSFFDVNDSGWVYISIAGNIAGDYYENFPIGCKVIIQHVIRLKEDETIRKKFFEWADSLAIREGDPYDETPYLHVKNPVRADSNGNVIVKEYNLTLNYGNNYKTGSAVETQSSSSSSSSSSADGKKKVIVSDGYVLGARVICASSPESEALPTQTPGEYEFSFLQCFKNMGAKDGVIDINDNGVMDAGEPKAPTMMAPGSYSNINPYTTLIAKGMEPLEVADAFGLAADTDFDTPVPESQDPDFVKNAVILSAMLAYIDSKSPIEVRGSLPVPHDDLITSSSSISSSQQIYSSSSSSDEAQQRPVMTLTALVQALRDGRSIESILPPELKELPQKLQDADIKEADDIAASYIAKFTGTYEGSSSSSSSSVSEGANTSSSQQTVQNPEDTNATLEKIIKVLTQKEQDIDGYFSHYGDGAYDWVYVSKSKKMIAKLEGMDEEGYFKWYELSNYLKVDINKTADKLIFKRK